MTVRNPGFVYYGATKRKEVVHDHERQFLRDLGGGWPLSGELGCWANIQSATPR